MSSRVLFVVRLPEISAGIAGRKLWRTIRSERYSVNCLKRDDDVICVVRGSQVGTEEILSPRSRRRRTDIGPDQHAIALTLEAVDLPVQVVKTYRSVGVSIISNKT